jgi:cysteinyl-tRNA synthetase
VEAPAEVVALARSRTEARAARDFAESDRLRDEIATAGWEVRDTPGAPGGFELVPLP